MVSPVSESACPRENPARSLRTAFELRCSAFALRDREGPWLAKRVETNSDGTAELRNCGSHWSAPHDTDGLEPLLRVVPDMRLHHLGSFIQFVLGLSGYARVHAHHAFRETAGVSISLRDWCREHRACLHCFCLSGVVHLDSEWHMVFHCSLHLNERKRLLEGSGGNVYQTYFDSDGAVSDLAALLLFSCGDTRRLGRVCVLVATMLHTRKCFLSRRELASSVQSRLA